jgi:hypothetical protein
MTAEVYNIIKDQLENSMNRTAEQNSSKTVNAATLTAFKTIKIDNSFSIDEIPQAFSIIKKSGINCISGNETLIFNFDEVDVNYLENNSNNHIVKALLDKLHKIRSFSTANGKIVYASFNKDKKVSNKAENKKRRLAYEYYKKDFPPETNDLPKNIINKIHCANSLDFLKKLPDNCVDLVLTSPPYNFGINYNNTNDVNQWQDYFDILFNIFRECIRVLKDGGRIIVNVQPMFSDYIPTHHFVSKFFIDEGLIWKGELIWEKNNYNCKYCTWGSWKSPAAPYLKRNRRMHSDMGFVRTQRSDTIGTMARNHGTGFRIYEDKLPLLFNNIKDI